MMHPDDLMGKARAALILIVLILSSCSVIAADHSQQRIDRIKAAFVLNIARFVTWTNAFDEENEFHLLCHYRGNTLGQAGATINGQKISGQVLKLESIDTLKESDKCKTLLIPENEIDEFDREISQGWEGSFLVIADLTAGKATTGIPRTGIHVSLVRKGVKIALEVNLSQARENGLQLSSQLLKLADIVDGEKKR